MNLVVMTLVVVIMCYSLTKIHKTLKNLPFLKQKINLNRMVVHSLAYIIYLVTYFVYKLLSQFKYDGDQYPYLNVTWFARLSQQFSSSRFGSSCGILAPRRNQ